MRAKSSFADVWHADVVFAVNAPTPHEVARLRDGAILVVLLSPGLNPELVDERGDADDLLRFVREQSVRLTHPFIVTPYSRGLPRTRTSSSPATWPAAVRWPP